MKQECNDVIIKVISEWEQFEAKLNWDVDCETMIRHFSNMLKSLTYTSYSIVQSLRNVADDIERDIEVYNDENNIIEDGTTN